MCKLILILLIISFVGYSHAIKCMVCPDDFNQQDCKEGKVDATCEGDVCFKATVKAPCKF